MRVAGGKEEGCPPPIYLSIERGKKESGGMGEERRQ